MSHRIFLALQVLKPKLIGNKVVTSSIVDAKTQSASMTTIHINAALLKTGMAFIDDLKKAKQTKNSLGLSLEAGASPETNAWNQCPTCKKLLRFEKMKSFLFCQTCEYEFQISNTDSIPDIMDSQKGLFNFNNVDKTYGFLDTKKKKKQPARGAKKPTKKNVNTRNVDTVGPSGEGAPPRKKVKLNSDAEITILREKRLKSFKICIDQSLGVEKDKIPNQVFVEAKAELLKFLQKHPSQFVNVRTSSDSSAKLKMSLFHEHKEFEILRQVYDTLKIHEHKKFYKNHVLIYKHVCQIPFCKYEMMSIEQEQKCIDYFVALNNLDELKVNANISKKSNKKSASNASSAIDANDNDGGDDDADDGDNDDNKKRVKKTLPFSHWLFLIYQLIERYDLATLYYPIGKTKKKLQEQYQVFVTLGKKLNFPLHNILMSGYEVVQSTKAAGARKHK